MAVSQKALRAYWLRQSLMSCPKSLHASLYSIAVLVMGRSPTEAEMSRAFSKKRPALGYWDNRGIAEPIRLLLHYVGVEFDDVRFDVGPPPAYDKSDWLLVKDHLGLSAPNLPYWIEPGGLRLTQSHAITLYLAQKHGVDGESAAVRGRAIMAHECVRDCVSAFMAVTYCNAPGYCDAPEDGVHAACRSSHRARPWLATSLSTSQCALHRPYVSSGGFHADHGTKLATK